MWKETTRSSVFRQTKEGTMECMSTGVCSSPSSTISLHRGARAGRTNEADEVDHGKAARRARSIYHRQEQNVGVRMELRVELVGIGLHSVESEKAYSTGKFARETDRERERSNLLSMQASSNGDHETDAFRRERVFAAGRFRSDMQQRISETQAQLSSIQHALSQKPFSHLR